MNFGIRAAVAVTAVLAIAGCSAPAPSPSPTPTPSVTLAAAPDGGVFLAELGFSHAPAGFSVPSSVIVAERVDAANNVTAVFTAPNGVEIASYLARNLPEMGFTVTADKAGSLLFEGGPYKGAFTTSGAYAALTLRTDQE